MSDISKAEFDVLDAIWQGYPVSAQTIIERLNTKQEWHEKTVKTLLSRLVKKGAVSFEKDKRRYLYTPLLEREAYTRQESESLIQRLFKGRLSPLVAGFAKNNELNEDDIEQLKKVISDWEHEHDK